MSFAQARRSYVAVAGRSTPIPIKPMFPALKEVTPQIFDRKPEAKQAEAEKQRDGSQSSGSQTSPKNERG